LHFNLIDGRLVVFRAGLDGQLWNCWFRKIAT